MLTIAPIEVSEAVRRTEKYSKCQRAQVACILTHGEQYQIAAYGVNHNPGKHTCERPEEKGNCGCIHAEINAAIWFTWTVVPRAAFVSRAPCGPCARVLAAMAVKEVYYFDDSWPMQDGFDVFNARGIKYAKIQHAE